ncbi:MAG: ABC transporter ATP-binding protein [Burkholderiaceae bacterium]
MKGHGAHLAIDAVSHAYRRGGELAIAEVSLEIEPGESVALVGRSGCGKSTLLHIACGLMKPTRGQVLVDGARVTAPSPEWVMMFQAPSLYPWMTVAQNVGLGLRFAGRRRETPARVAEMLALVELEAFAQRNVQDLSGGQQQRVALARSLALEPEVLLLDEPFSALDAFTRHSLQRDVRRIAKARSITLVFVTHDINEAVTMADRAVVMAANPGRISEIVAIDVDGERAASSPSFGLARERLVAAYERTTGLEMGDAAGAGLSTRRAGTPSIQSGPAPASAIRTPGAANGAASGRMTP